MKQDRHTDAETSGSAPALKRADARINRERALEAARVCFSDPGRDASMEDIARTAGVGVGTLYRAFGNRSALAEAVFADMVARLVLLAPDVLAQDDPWDALAGWLRYYVEQMLSKRAMIAELQPLFTSKPDMLSDARRQAAASLADVMAPAQKAGLLREGLTAFDVLQLVDGIVGRGGADRDRAGFMLDIVLAGMRNQAGCAPPSASVPA